MPNFFIAAIRCPFAVLGALVDRAAPMKPVWGHPLPNPGAVHSDSVFNPCCCDDDTFVQSCGPCIYDRHDKCRAPMTPGSVSATANAVEDSSVAGDAPRSTATEVPRNGFKWPDELSRGPW